MGKVKIIVVNGVSRSGKDTFIDFLRTEVPVLIEHSTIKTVSQSLCDYSMLDYRKKGMKERKFLASVKQAWIEYNDGPFQEVVSRKNSLERDYKFQNNIDRILLVVQVREPEEIKKLSNFFDTDMWSVLVKRIGAKFQHITDEFVEDWDYDFIIHNYGPLKDMEKHVNNFIYFLSKEK